MSLSNLHRNSTESNKHTPKGFTDATNNSKLIRDERGESRYVDNINIGTFIDFADPTLAPPTTTNNHVYVLVGTGTVDADWGSAVENDIVRFFDGVPIAVTPTAGYFGYNLTENKYYRFETSWVEFASDSENIATNDLALPSATTRTLTIPSDSILDLGANLRVRNNILELQSVTRGFLMNRVTTIQMNAIVGMSDNELVFNTDLKAIYRYDATLLQWVALSAGYGIIEVQNGTGTGQPTYFADLQNALETCKASGGYFTVKLYSNLTITSAIEIDYTGSGTGKAYQFRQLTIDFNGFSVTNAQANTTDAFTLQLSNSASVYQEIRMINGNVLRTNGTGTHHALKCNQTDRFGTIQMYKMFFYCENSFCATINLGNTTSVEDTKIMDLGGSTFVSNGNITLRIDGTDKDITNFKSISNSAFVAFICNNGTVSDFVAENTSTGVAFIPSANIVARNFTARSNSGNAINIETGTIMSFRALSVTGRGVNSETASCVISDFFAKTGNNFALRVGGSGDNITNVSNAKCESNGDTQCVYLQNIASATNIEALNNGAGSAIDIRSTGGSRMEISNIKAISVGLRGGYLDCSSGNTMKITNSMFGSHNNTSSGHAIWIVGLGVAQISNSYFFVRNSSANVLHATSATTVKSFSNTHNEVASTPINANVTITALASF